MSGPGTASRQRHPRTPAAASDFGAPVLCSKRELEGVHHDLLPLAAFWGTEMRPRLAEDGRPLRHSVYFQIATLGQGKPGRNERDAKFYAERPNYDRLRFPLLLTVARRAGCGARHRSAYLSPAPSHTAETPCSISPSGSGMRSTSTAAGGAGTLL